MPLPPPTMMIMVIIDSTGAIMLTAAVMMIVIITVGDSNGNGMLGNRMAKPRKRRRPEDDLILYVVAVENWGAIYGISATKGHPLATGRYDELAVLELTGNVIQPGDLKYPRASRTLYSREGMLRPAGDEPTDSIGMLNGVDERLSIWANIPAERMAGVMALAPSNRIRATLITGTSLRYRRGLVHNLELITRCDEEEY